MALGCPVIAAPCGALPEVCGKAAIYADPQDSEAWATAIAALAAGISNREHLVSRGRKQAAEFTWRASAITLAKVLSSI
jgi:glycosyltransferase involved in cell wall biosynthesis